MKSQPSRQDLIRCFADIAVQAGFPDRAAAALTTALRTHAPASAQARAQLYPRLSDIEQQMADLPAAVDALRQAVALVPKDRMTLAALARTLDANGQKSEALDVYRTITGVEPSDPAALNARAASIVDLDYVPSDGDSTVALTCAHLAHQLQPDDPATTEVYARTEFRFNLYRGLPVFEELVAKYPESFAYHKFLAISLMQRRENDRALAELQQALKYAATDEDRLQIQRVIASLTAALKQ